MCHKYNKVKDQDIHGYNRKIIWEHIPLEVTPASLLCRFWIGSENLGKS
jgi:hypothetical protein